MFDIRTEKRAVATKQDIDRIGKFVAFADQVEHWRAWARITAAYFGLELDERVWAFAQALMAIQNSSDLNRARITWHTKQGAANLFEFKVELW